MRERGEEQNVRASGIGGAVVVLLLLLTCVGLGCEDVSRIVKVGGSVDVVGRKVVGDLRTLKCSSAVREVHLKIPSTWKVHLDGWPSRFTGNAHLEHSLGTLTWNVHSERSLGTFASVWSWTAVWEACF